MRSLALVSGSIIALAAAAGQTSLPTPLTQDFAALGAASSLTVVYTVKMGADAALPYKLVLSRPSAFRLTTPTGYVVSDGTTVTTYTTATNRYAQSPYSDAWAKGFSHRLDVLPWAPFLLKDGASDVDTAKAGESRKVAGFDTDSVAVGLKKGPSAVLYLDKKNHVSRGALISQDGKETLLVAKEVTIGKAPEAPDTFVFTPPAGASMEAPAVTFTQVKALIDDRCMPCHAAARPRAGVNLGTYEGVMANVKPGDADGSLLIKSVKGDGVRKMPLGNHPALSADEIKMWSDWIAAGAKNG